MKPIYFITVVLVGVIALLLVRTDPTHTQSQAPSTTPTAAVANCPNTSIHVDSATLASNYCSSSAEEVNRGTKAVLSVLNRITAQPFFRYYKVNSDRPCPYWAVSLLCTSPESLCDVCKCDENDVPVALREPADMSTLARAAGTPDGSLVNLLGHPLGADGGDAEQWGPRDDGAEYVDLVNNPEGNTGYSGPLAARVWKSIYEENCLSVENEEGHCREVAVLRTLLSGLHFSINIHVCTNFYKDPELRSPQLRDGIYNNPNISFFPNCDMYRQRVLPSGQFLGNLYVLHEFVLRALTIAKPLFLEDGATHVGRAGTVSPEDATLRRDLEELFGSTLLCSTTFDETVFLESPRAAQLVPSMKAMMLNVSTIMDCVSCEKCRIWGKLEVKGLATALNIVMHPRNEPLTLDRSEKVSLMNLARQVSFAVYNAQKLGEVCAALDAEKQTPAK